MSKVYVNRLFKQVRERDNAPNGLTNLPGRDGCTGPLGNAIVSSSSSSSSPRVALLHLLVGKDEQDLGKKSRGGRCRRRLIEGVFLSKSGTCSPRPCAQSPFSCVVQMHISGVSFLKIVSYNYEFTIRFLIFVC